MSSFASFSQFIRHGGQASIILSLLPVEPSLELKQSSPDLASVDAFEQHLRHLAAENWSGMTAAFARAGIEADPIAEDIEAEIARARAAFSEQASVILATSDPSVANADISTLAEWLARRFLTEINERRQRQLGVTHFIWRTQDDEKVRAAHAERDDRVFSWQDWFPDGAPGHGYNCRCVAEPAIVDGTILLTDAPASPELSDRIARAQAGGLADAATDAAVGGATSVYNLLRFSWLGYRRLFGIITPEEEAERLAMREGVFRAIDALAALDEETLRRLADAFVDHFDARHADLRLLDLEYRLSLASEETLLRAYRDVAYMDGATTLGTTAFATFATRLGINLTRLRPRDAFVALRPATARMETLLAIRRTNVSAFVARRFAELEAQGHGPQRHEGAVTQQMLIDRVLDGKDPMTGTSVDGVTGRPHRPPPIATRIKTPEAFVTAESYLRRTAEYRAARDAALFAPMYRRGSFSVVLSLDDALGPDYLRLVEGVRRVDGRIVDVDFEGGLLLAIFRLEPSGAPALVTMYPVGR
jgi:SPP1 gp7 family putative phage head morphogenesis protein